MTNWLKRLTAQKVGMTEPATANARGQSIDPVKHALLTLLSLWVQTTISALPWMALTYLYIDAPVNPRTNPFAFLLFVLVGAPLRHSDSRVLLPKNQRSTCMSYPRRQRSF